MPWDSHPRTELQFSVCLERKRKKDRNRSHRSRTKTVADAVVAVGAIWGRSKFAGGNVLEGRFYTWAACC
uniref:Uncharacterized protein n=1 Tax=Tetraselmis sp. GSL018 TaxID=582737 RepID=A0A061QYP0_9CHLO